MKFLIEFCLNLLNFISKLKAGFFQGDTASELLTRSAFKFYCFFSSKKTWSTPALQRGTHRHMANDV